jgi:TRAP-type C4-dicarboxylate transport system substrate-binding protein
MRRSLSLVCLLTMALWTVPGSTARTEAEQATVIRMATLAPAGSSWMKVFQAWDQSLQKETNGRLKFRFYPGGSQGDERDFVRKVRVGQLDAGAVTTTGLSMLIRPVLVLVVPGLLDTYEELDRVRAKMDSHFEEMFADSGFQLLAWGDAGKTRIFSVDKLESPSQLKSMRVWAWKDDLIFNELYEVIGANPIRLGVPEVYPALQTKMVDTVAASALAAVTLQWYSRVRYVTAHNTAIIVGAIFMRKDKFDALEPDLQTALMSTADRMEVVLNKSIRRDDQKAYDVVRERGIVAVEAGTHKAEWEDAFRKVRERLTGRVYSKSLLQAVEQAARE